MHEGSWRAAFDVSDKLRSYGMSQTTREMAQRAECKLFCTQKEEANMGGKGSKWRNTSQEKLQVVLRYLGLLNWVAVSLGTGQDSREARAQHFSSFFRFVFEVKLSHARGSRSCNLVE